MDKVSEDWSKYISYLKQWADDHQDPTFAGMSPACYDEWNDNENQMEEN